jgi:hypothetical protein
MDVIIPIHLVLFSVWSLKPHACFPLINLASLKPIDRLTNCNTSIWCRHGTETSPMQVKMRVEALDASLVTGFMAQNYCKPKEM